jgi:hypothetical protein
MSRFITQLFILFSSTLIISCQKEISVELGQNGAVPATPASAIFKMKIDGSQWIATRQANATILVGFTSIIGISADAKTLSITLNDSVPGTYVLDQKSFNAAALSDSADLAGLSYSTDQGSDTTQAGGVVVVTAIDKVKKTISGTFYFKLYRDFDKKQKGIIEGSFVNLPFLTTLPAAAITDTLNVSIDNVAWKAKSISGTLSGASLYITGSELDLSKLVALSIPGNIAAGTYSFDAVTGNYIGVYSPVANSYMTSQSGKLTIIEHNSATKRIRGNFDFKAVDLITAKASQLTGGYFSIGYQ